MIETVLRAFVLLMIATIVVTPPRARAGETAQPPFSASVSSGYAPLSVAFSYQYESTNSHWMLAIDFGDASSGEMQLPAPSRCAKAPDSASKCPGFRWQSVHAYEYPGIYVATLTRGASRDASVAPPRFWEPKQSMFRGADSNPSLRPEAAATLGLRSY